LKKIFNTKIFKKNAKGFSLVEVLCAIVLLALVATPILQALCQGMVVNNKSRKMLAAADLASDTMEFVSSLSFNDFKYTNSGGTEITVPGLKSYYWGNDINAVSPTLILTSLKLGGVQKLYPNGPHAEVDYLSYINVSGWDTGTKERTANFKNVKMDGYDFKVQIIMRAPDTKVVSAPGGGLSYATFEFSDLTAEKYYCYDVTVNIIEPGTNKVLATASTSVPNKF